MFLRSNLPYGRIQILFGELTRINHLVKEKQEDMGNRRNIRKAEGYQKGFEIHENGNVRAAIQ